MRILLTSISIFSLNACTPVETVQPIATAKTVQARMGQSGLGNVSARLSESGSELWLDVVTTNFVPGVYGIHLHSVGKCDGPDFTTAGAHWNPTQTQHGFDNPMGTHVGDIRNLDVNANGLAVIQTKIEGGRFDGPNGAMDEDGIAIIIHEKADDYATDPSGNSGKRILCGVFTQSERMD
jgi:superoxide dismutase, Cu-Zn family